MEPRQSIPNRYLMAFAILDCGRLSIAHFVNFVKLFCGQRQVIILELAETIRFERMDLLWSLVFKTSRLNQLSQISVNTRLNEASREFTFTVSDFNPTKSSRLFKAQRELKLLYQIGTLPPTSAIFSAQIGGSNSLRSYHEQHYHCAISGVYNPTPLYFR